MNKMKREAFEYAVFISKLVNKLLRILPANKLVLMWNVGIRRISLWYVTIVDLISSGIVCKAGIRVDTRTRSTYVNEDRSKSPTLTLETFYGAQGHKKVWMLE